MPMEMRTHIQSLLPTESYAALFMGPQHEGIQGWAAWVGGWGACLGLYLAFKGLWGAGTPAFKKGACT